MHTIPQLLLAGTIAAWTPRPDSETSDLELPHGWIECDGSVIPEPSIWAGKRLPNLNAERRFLRGGSKIGALTLEDDMMQSMPALYIMNV